jgi:hypothetical protein
MPAPRVYPRARLHALQKCVHRLSGAWDTAASAASILPQQFPTGAPLPVSTVEAAWTIAFNRFTWTRFSFVLVWPSAPVPSL